MSCKEIVRSRQQQRGRSLHEVMAVRSSGGLPCDYVRATLTARVQELDEKIRELQDKTFAIPL